MMKKLISSVLALCMLGSMLTACSSSSSTESTTTASSSTTETSTATTTTTTETAATGWWSEYEGELEHMPDVANMDAVHLTFAAPEVGSATNVTTNNLVSVMLQYLPEGSVIDVTTDMVGTGTSPFLITNETCDLCMGDSAPTKWATSGTTPNLEGTVATNVYTIGGNVSFSCLVCVFSESFVAKTGYTSLEQALADNYPLRISSKATGTLGEMLCGKVLACCGYTYDDINAWGGSITSVEQSQAIDMLKDGQADVYIDHNNVNNAYLTELCMTTDCLFVQFGDELLTKLKDECGLSDHTIVAESFAGLPNADVQTVASTNCWLISGSTDDDVAYLLTMALCESIEELQSLNSAFDVFDPATGWSSDLTGTELHSGSLLYYQDKGYC